MLDYVGRVVKKTGNVIVGLANSGLVSGASKLGTGVLKAGVEGGAGLLNKGIKGAQKNIPKLKNISGKQISDGVGTAVNKTMVGRGSDYKPKGSFRGSRKSSGRPKTTYVSTNDSFGALDAITDRAKTYMDGAAHILQGDSYLTGKQALIKTGSDNYMPFGLKATGLGTTLAIGASAASGIPDAAKQWNDGRKGYNQDTQPMSIAPQTPAYANNGGATGDLVFALNNLRNGGMM